MVGLNRLCLIIFGPLLFFIQGILTYNKFCPVICSDQACSTNLTGSCTGCSPPWTWNTTTSTCELYSSSGYGFVDNSVDMGGSIGPDITT